MEKFITIVAGLLSKNERQYLFGDNRQVRMQPVVVRSNRRISQRNFK